MNDTAAPTYELARAAAWDAGNRAMRAAGRKRWNEDDWNTACDELERLWPAGRAVSAQRKRKTGGTNGGRPPSCVHCGKPEKEHHGRSGHRFERRPVRGTK